MSFLQELKVEFLRAPYSSLAQLSYMYRHRNQIVHSVYGGFEALLFDIDQVIDSFSEQKGTFTWVRKSNVLAALEFNPEQFLDLCILNGVGLGLGFGIESKLRVSSTFQEDYELLKFYKSGISVVQNIANHEPNVAQASYTDDFCRIKASIIHHPVLHDDGCVLPLNPETCPNDLHQAIGYVLPNQIYQLLSKGLIDTQILGPLVSGTFVEEPPFDFGQSKEYQSYIYNVISPLYTRSMALITPRLHAFYRTKRITLQSYFSLTLPSQPEKAKSFAGSKYTKPTSINVLTSSWQLPHAEAATGFDRIPGTSHNVSANHAFKAYTAGQLSVLALDVVEPILLNTQNIGNFGGQVDWAQSMVNFSQWSDDSKLKSLDKSFQKIGSEKELLSVLWLTALRHFGLAPPIKYAADNSITPATNLVDSTGFRIASGLIKAMGGGGTSETKSDEIVRSSLAFNSVGCYTELVSDRAEVVASIRNNKKEFGEVVWLMNILQEAMKNMPAVEGASYEEGTDKQRCGWNEWKLELGLKESLDNILGKV
ncbi:hypothetical protein BB559_004661 [Furculomyces boomerangus]|uniref:Post-transcriptional regulator MKT1 N-terminal domain-containing protein n=2 Tax=Harpellales TaxID=61421 RepID=A0A2T9YDG5_9FUNG|nr:hypothetical protein BB559_004661 [Furculomyces boomerangus]